MTTGFSIKQATEEQVVKYFYEWPNGEQWNPCNSNDVTTLYFSSDPNGFFIGTIKNEQDDQETVVAIISAIKHNPDTVFVGHYIVHPDYRGKGYGLAIFDHAVKNYAKGVKYIGLDAVHAQIHNYKKSGFNTETWNSKRYQGDFEKKDLKKRIEKSDHYLSTSGFETKLLSQVPASDLVEIEKKYTGLERPTLIQQLATTFTDPSKGKYGLAIVDKNNHQKVLAYGVVRPVQQGYIIGPLFGENKDQISALVYHLIDAIHKAASDSSTFQVENHQSLFAVNVCEKNEDAMDLFVNVFGWTTFFECARMWVGQPPKYDVSGIYGAATYESG
ncbi:unnamed protein product [Cunninghamella blakesleeana]